MFSTVNWVSTTRLLTSQIYLWQKNLFVWKKTDLCVFLDTPLHLVLARWEDQTHILLDSVRKPSNNKKKSTFLCPPIYLVLARWEDQIRLLSVLSERLLTVIKKIDLCVFPRHAISTHPKKKSTFLWYPFYLVLARWEDQKWKKTSDLCVSWHALIMLSSPVGKIRISTCMLPWHAY